jgi:demethylmenaquinone methyltransferase/2-methoxy-6-polyprenyl-1,4-benzoquinol methylase
MNKKQFVKEMFNDIAHKYDVLNHGLSMGIDRTWRKKVVKTLQAFLAKAQDTEPYQILDAATGTADLAIDISALPGVHVTGVDIASEMLKKGKQKIVKKNLGEKITLALADVENMKDYPDNSFHGITIAFGVRNFENIEKGIAELARVLKPKYPLIILDFGMIKKFPLNILYRSYFYFLLPLTGKIISGNKYAYKYLPNSVKDFDEKIDLVQFLQNARLKNVFKKPLSSGIVSIYTAIK